jgi:hypothetical protein
VFKDSAITLISIGFLDFVHLPETLHNTVFRKLDLCPYSGEGREIHVLLVPLERPNLSDLTTQSQSQSYITTDSRPVRLGVRHPSGTHDQFFPCSLFISFLDSCGFVGVGRPKFNFKLHCDRRSVGQFVLVPSPQWGPWPDFTFFFFSV